jgi:hypothetical protein
MRGSEYLGCAILGFGFGIAVNGKLILPDTSAVVKAEALELDAHSKAVADIRELLREAGGESMMEVDTEINSSRQVYRMINARAKVDDETVMKRLSEAVSRLSFNETYLPAQIEAITKAIRFLTIDADKSVDDWPMYLDPSMIYDVSRTHQVLAAFGPTAPSFVDSAGTEFGIPKGLDDLDPLSVVDISTGKRPLESIFITMKRIPQAVGDWTNVVKKRRIRINVLERAAGYRTIQFRGNSRNDLWSTLKLIPFEVEKGKKRARGEEEDGEGDAGPSRKKGKEKETVANEIDYAGFF